MIDRFIKKRRLELGICLFLVTVSLGVYLQVSGCDFVNYDDELYVIKNPHIKAGLTLESTIWAFTTGYAANWHPLTWLSHMLDFQLYSLNPMGHHWTNLQIHIVNTVLLFLFLKWVTGAIWRSAFVSALFAVHPLHVESVAWVAERKRCFMHLFLDSEYVGLCRLCSETEENALSIIGHAFYIRADVKADDCNLTICPFVIRFLAAFTFSSYGL